MSGVKIALNGVGDAIYSFNGLAREIGDKKAQSKVLIPATRDAMKVVLAAAKAAAPKDTGQLAATLHIEARRPTRADRKSKYVTGTDTIIAKITTKPFPKKLRKKFAEENAALFAKDKKAYSKKFKAYAKEINFPYDARAVAQEFGTASVPERPFMRPALENNAQTVVKNFGNALLKHITKYRAKNK